MASDDELARTATAGAASSPATGPFDKLAPGASLGRYKLERELGAGAMGIVHLAYDADLERRIALKVLRSAQGDDSARQRLLREARAMARLAHPNVVTVHEVGSEHGRDFVAMELVDGETLADWLKAAKRGDSEILDAFVAAGRGLAAAHAAEIVHRDFKPHNVLRSRVGRIVVTDFGLARSVDTEPTAGESIDLMAQTASIATSTSRGPKLAGLTMTGALLGTPGYMAPEQWRNAALTPATDQFAYCVALWEALTGARPFQGETLEELKTAVLAGPSRLDPSALPRRLRAPLLRGLAIDPAARFPSMDALLDAIVRDERKSALPIGLAVGGVLVLAGIAVYSLATREPAQPVAAVVDPCRGPMADPRAVLSPGLRDTLAKQQRDPVLAALDVDAGTWKQARTQACGMAENEREPRLRCLDGVAARFSLLAQAAAAQPVGAFPLELGGMLIDPAVCVATPPPTLLALSSAGLRAVFAEQMRAQVEHTPITQAAAAQLIAGAGTEPCARALANLYAGGASEGLDRDHLNDEARTGATACTDDRIRADIAMELADTAMYGDRPTAIADVRAAEAAVQRVPQADLRGWLAAHEMNDEIQRGNLARAIAVGESAVTGYQARGRLDAVASTVVGLSYLYELRGTPADLARIVPRLRDVRKQVVARYGPSNEVQRRLDQYLALMQFRRGDVTSARATIDAARLPEPVAHPTPVAGTVVDEAGKPVAGATVAVGSILFATESALPDPIFDSGTARTAVTDAAGHFAIPDGPPSGSAAAAHGAERSVAVAIPTTEPLVLHLAPTGRIEGKIELNGVPSYKVSLAALPLASLALSFQVVASVQPDGSFVIAGVPRGQTQVVASVMSLGTSSMISAKVDLAQAVVTGVTLKIPTAAARTIAVVLRGTTSEPVPNGVAYVVAGVHGNMTWKDLLPLMPSAAFRDAHQLDADTPEAAKGVAQTGDLYASITTQIDGLVSVCALALPADMTAPDFAGRVHAHPEKVEVRCKPAPPGTGAVLVEVPPWPRL